MVVGKTGSLGLPAARHLPDHGHFVVLDSWRGIAALGIVFFHLNESLPSAAFLENAWALVDLFFVLSGFVISSSYMQRLSDGFSIRRFMLLRLGRLYPLHLFVLALWLLRELLQAVFHAQGLANREAFTAGYDMPHFLQVLFLVQVLPPETMMSWSAQSWSISAEVMLYLLFGSAFALTRRLALPLSILLLGLVAVYATGWASLGVTINWNLCRGLYGFSFGVIAWLVWERGFDKRLRALPSQSGTALELGVVAACIALLSLGEQGMTLLGLVPAFAVLVLVHAAETGALSRLLRTAGFVWLGILSYSIYMLHPLAIDAANLVWRMSGLVEIGRTDGLLVSTSPNVALLVLSYAVVTALTIFGAYLTWRYLEWPARNWSRAKAEQWGAGRAERRAPTI